MTTPAINWIQPKRGWTAENRRADDYAFLLSMYGSGVRNARGETSKQGSITISERVMRELRWQIADRVLVGTSNGGQDVYLKRVPTGGYALSASGSRTRKDFHGKSAKANIKSKLLIFPMQPTPIGFKDFLVLEDGTVMFSIPPVEATASSKPALSVAA